MGWFFLLLAIMFTGIALNPDWRKSWGWGRTGQAGPLSPIGWGAWIFAFLMISGTGFDLVHGNAVLLAFAGVMVAGIWDSYKKPKN